MRHTTINATTSNTDDYYTAGVEAAADLPLDCFDFALITLGERVEREG